MDDALSTCLEYSGDTDDARIQEGIRRKLGGLVGRLEKWLDASDSENPAASFEVPADSDMTHSWDSDGPLFSHVITTLIWTLPMHFACIGPYTFAPRNGSMSLIKKTEQGSEIFLKYKGWPSTSVAVWIITCYLRISGQEAGTSFSLPELPITPCPKPHANLAGSQAFSRILQLTLRLKLAGRYCTIFLCLQEAVSQIWERAILRTNETGHCTNDLSQNLASTARPLHSC